ncbi:glucanase B [Xylaria intraflava]|nr:glucanase B [Xylaria intraflava]
MTKPTTQIAFKNNTGSSTAYAYVTGLDINKGSVYAFLQPDGKTLYYPASPSQPLQPLAVDCAIPMGAPGTTTTVTIPQLAGGRIWFVIDSKLTFLLNPGPSIVEPSVTNTDDANYKLKWGFCEFTCYVDFVSVPIALALRNTAGQTQTVRGLPADGLDQVCTQLTAQSASENPSWAKLIVKGPDGKNLRALSPNSGRVGDSTLFNGYYQPYVDQAWSKYTSTDLKVDTQAQWGVVTGRVSNGVLTFPNAGTFAKPAAIDIFSCSTGPFANYPAATRDQMGAIGARLAAALNRSTLVANPNQPDTSQGTGNDYYKTSPTNHYARIVHGVNLDGRGYAFPYDDVAATGATGPDQAGTVYDGSPDLLTVTVGGPDAGSGYNGGKGKDANGDDNDDDGDDDGDNNGSNDDGKKKKSKSSFDFSGLLKKIVGVLKGLICK